MIFFKNFQFCQALSAGSDNCLEFSRRLHKYDFFYCFFFGALALVDNISWGHFTLQEDLDVPLEKVKSQTWKTSKIALVEPFNNVLAIETLG